MATEEGQGYTGRHWPMTEREMPSAIHRALRRAGLKVTEPRCKILEILEAADPQHISAEEIYRILRETGDAVSLATVYRVLTQFEQSGLAIRHGFVSGHAIFEMHRGVHHDHLVCLQCGRIEEFIDEVIEARQHEIAAHYQFKVTAHSHYLYGYCQHCQGP